MKQRHSRTWSSFRALVVAAVGFVMVRPPCAAAQRPSPADDAAARRVLLAYLATNDRQLIGGEHRTFDPAWVGISWARSRVVPGLAFWWGAYSPPRTYDVFVDVAVARVGDSTRVVETVEDWAALARLAHWRPAGPRTVLSGCAEAVSVAGPRAWHAFAPYLYLGPASVRREQIFRYADQSWRRRMQRPVTRSLGPEAWEATFWMIEPRQSTRYRCKVVHGALHVTQTDSLPGLGQDTPGP